MRRLLPFVVVLAWPSGGQATPPDATLTLHAPGATRFDHRIQFAGRLTPAVPEARIRLYRRQTLITVQTANDDGTYRIPVRLERPGPFHVEWNGSVSPSMTVELHPLLAVRLVGAGVVGRPFGLVVRLQPGSAGPVRVQITRDERLVSSRLVYGSARLGLATDRLGAYRVEARTIPAPGYAAATRELRTTVRPPQLAYGAQSPALRQLLGTLAALHYAIPRVQTTLDGDVLESVYAFEKVQGLARTGVVDAAFWSRLEHPLVPSPRYGQPTAHIEIDKSKQVLYVVRNGEVTLISPVSTAGIPGYYTPVG
ncbi:MAG: hypothetical protein C5B48_03540, partial [Candidatus Rokuibacteriota bacterium]